MFELFLHPVRQGVYLRALTFLAVCLCPVYCQCSSTTNLTATDNYQEVTSPGYPSDYASDLNCDWYITTSNFTDIIQLVFLDLSTEGAGICLTDYVTIYDGDPNWSTRLGRYCGTKTPDTIYSSGTILVVEFRTDSSKTSRGFKAKYMAGPWSSFSPDEIDSSDSLPAIIGASVGSVLFIVVMATVSALLYKHIKAKKLADSRQRSHTQGQLSSNRIQPYGDQRNNYYGDNVGNQPPPAYTENCDRPLWSPPPAYSEYDTYTTR